jgi:hypothetical protein
MLTPIDFKNNYFALLAESEQITGVRPDNSMFWRNDSIFSGEIYSITSEQWSNLVKVASIIKSNQNRLNMNAWHTLTDCGTSHCVCGWAVSLYMNDTNYSSINVDELKIARNMLSHYAQPFFWIMDYNLNLEKGFYKGLPEQLVMKWFIDPILEEACKESHQLSSEITQFVQKSQQDQMATCGV